MVSIARQNNLPAKVGDGGLSLRDVIFVLFRRRWVVLLISLPIILVGGLSLFRQTSSYSASCRVLVELSKVDLPRWNTTSRGIDYDRELSTMFNIAMSLPVAEMAAESLADSIPSIIKMLPNRVRLREPGALRDFLLEKSDVSAVGESNILEFRFSSANMAVSIMAVGALRDAFVEYQVHSRKNVKSITYYTEQYQTVQSEVDSLLQLRAQFLVKSGYSDITDQMRNEVGKLADLQVKLLATTADRRSLEDQYKNLKVYLVGNPLAFPIGLDESKSFTLVYWRNMVSKHQDELHTILATHTEESIPARRQRAIVDSSMSRLKQEEEAYVESVRLQYQSLLIRERTLTEQVEMVGIENARGPKVESRISMLDVEVESLRSLLKSIQGKLGEVRLSQMADERVSAVTSLSDPEGLYSLSGGKTIIYFIVIVVFAIALGVVVALVLEGMDHRVYYPRDVEEKLRLPVFASVTRVD